MATPTHPPALEPWLQQRLQNIFQRPRALRFEASLYGPLNAYLGTYFPVSRNFMVKPQATLRPAADASVIPPIPATQDIVHDADDVRSEDWDQLEQSRAGSPIFMEGIHEERGGEEEGEEEEEEEEEEEREGEGEKEKEDGEEEGDIVGDVSMGSADSYGQHPEPGTKGIGIPDFVVVKATGACDGDMIVLVVEVKKRWRPQTNALFQLSTYLQLAAEKNHAQRLRGILIRGRLSTAIEIVRIDGDLNVLVLDREMQTNGEAFNEYINTVAMENWA